jgi:hypothetical protein
MQMFIIEYVSATPGQPLRSLFSELALGSTPEEAMDQADTHLPALKEKHGPLGYRIIDRNQQCVASQDA